jgi:hypothetical protein
MARTLGAAIVAACRELPAGCVTSLMQCEADIGRSLGPIEPVAIVASPALVAACHQPMQRSSARRFRTTGPPQPDGRDGRINVPLRRTAAFQARLSAPNVVPQ